MRRWTHGRCSSSSPPRGSDGGLTPRRHRRARRGGEVDARPRHSGCADRLHRRVLGRRGLRVSSASSARWSTPLAPRRSGARSPRTTGRQRQTRGLPGGRARRRRGRRGRLRTPPAAPRRLRRARLGRGAVRRAARARRRAGRRGSATAPGRTCGCRPRTATWSGTTRSAARTSSWTAQRGRRCSDGVGAAAADAPRLRSSRRRASCERRAAGRATRERPSVDRDDRHHLPHRRRREHLVGGEQPLERERPPRRPRPVPRGELEQGGARLAGEDADLERRRQSTSPSRHQMFVTGPSSTIPSASTKTASSAPRAFASASAAMLTA